MVSFSKMFTGSTISGSDQSGNVFWRSSVHHNEEFRKDIEKVEKIVGKFSLCSMFFIVALLVKTVLL